MSTSIITVATSLRQDADISSSNPTVIGGNRQNSQGDPDRGAQKRPRRKGSSVEGVSQTPTSYTTRDTHATSIDTGVDRDDEASV